MTLTAQIAKHFRDVYFGGNWTASDLEKHLEAVDWQQATTRLGSLNTIALLVFHINYYVEAILNVMKGNALEASDKFSFNLQPIESQQEWEQLLNKVFKNAEELISLIGQMPESKLWETFSNEKYGNYYRNLHGLIEHTHYHLGQIVVIKKMLQG